MMQYVILLLTSVHGLYLPMIANMIQLFCNTVMKEYVMIAALYHNAVKLFGRLGQQSECQEILDKHPSFSQH